jgi:hypothetical protein
MSAQQDKDAKSNKQQNSKTTYEHTQQRPERIDPRTVGEDRGRRAKQ